MEAEFHFCCGIEEYCKCGRYCRGNTNKAYIESYMSCEPELEKIISKISSSQHDFTFEPYDNKWTQRFKYNEWSILLLEIGKENIIFLFKWVIKNNINPYDMYTNTNHAWNKVLDKFTKLMRNSLSELDNETVSLLPNKTIKKFNKSDYSFLLNDLLYHYSGLEKHGIKPYIRISESIVPPGVCDFCGICESCRLYNEGIKTSSSFLKESFTLPELVIKYPSIIEELSDVIYNEIMENTGTLGVHKKYWIKTFSGDKSLLWIEMDENKNNPKNYKEYIHRYIKLVVGVSSFKSFVVSNKKNTRIGKQIFLDRVFDSIDSCRYLPLGEVMPEWENISSYHSQDKKFNIEILEELVIALGGRIFGLSIVIEDILADKNDSLFPLWKEMNACIQDNRFFAAQSAVATLFGLVRDTRCVEDIKYISSTLERNNFMTAFSNLINKFEEDALIASVLLIPFVHSDEIPVSARSTSMSRNGTVHKGMEYFSKFNMLGMLLSLCYLVKEMYRYGSTSSFNKIFKPQSEW